MSKKSLNSKLPKIEEAEEEEETLSPKVDALTKLYRALWAMPNNPARKEVSNSSSVQTRQPAFDPTISKPTPLPSILKATRRPPLKPEIQSLLRPYHGYGSKFKDEELAVDEMKPNVKKVRFQ